MPKLGRRNEIAELEYQWKENMTTTQLAPFGTQDTPTMRTKIVGGKPFMVAEDRNRVPIQPQTIEDLTPPGKTPRRSGIGGETSPRLAPLTEKPNHFDPTPFMSARNAQNSQLGFGNGPQQSPVDSLYRHRDEGVLSQSSRSSMNPHPVVPPIQQGISNNPTPNEPTYPSSVPRAPNDVTELLRHLPRDSFLPRAPVTYTKREELELRRRVHLDLKGVDPKRFKEIYTELTGYDRHLTGTVTLQDFSFTLNRQQVNLNALHLRLIAAMFVDDGGKINYEKLLSFLAASQRDASVLPAGGPTTDPNANLEELELAAEGVRYNVISHMHEDFSPRSQKYPYSDRDNAKLLRYLEEQLTGNEDDLDMEKAWSGFSRADRDKRGTMSAEQIHKLVSSLGIPLQGSLINAIIDKCDYSNGQIRWEQFLEFINRVAPRKTGLKIPESKKPLEYVKHYPVPDTNWPKGEWDNTEYGIPRNQQKPVAPATRRQQSPPPQPPRGHDNPNDLLPKYNPQRDQLEELEERTRRQTEADRHQRNLDRMEQEYQTRNQRDSRSQNHHDEPWFDRFMKLANAIYNRDSRSTGKVAEDEMKWLVDKYNRIEGLGLSDREADHIIDNHTHSGQSAIDPVLRELGLLGP